MEVRSDREYRFPFEPDALWSALSATSDYQRWWPWLREFEARGLVAGDRWRCTVKPPLPYSLRFTIELIDVVPVTTLSATISGDIAGRARIDIEPDDGGSRLHLTSTLAPSNRAFAVIATVARPVVKRGHDWVLDTGAAQFAEHAGD